MQAQTGRQVNKTVYLPVDTSLEELASDPEVLPDEYSSYQTPSAPDEKYPILVYCKADSINLKKLVHLLRNRFPDSNVKSYAECVHSQYHRPGGGELVGDMFFFDVRPGANNMSSEVFFKTLLMILFGDT